MDTSKIDSNRLISGLARIVNRKNDAFVRRELAPTRGGMYDSTTHQQYVIYEDVVKIIFDSLPYEVKDEVRNYIARQR